MLAISAASALLFRSFGERIVDPRNLFGANLSDLGQHLLALFGFWQLSAAAIETHWEDPPIMPWRLAGLGFAAALITTYMVGGEWTAPSEEFQLSDGWSLAHDWLNLISLLATVIVVLLVSLQTMLVGPRRISMILMYVFATIMIGRIGTVVVMLLAQPAWVHAHYYEWATKWATVGLWVMGAAGIPAFWEAWIGRQEPHR